jgi:hypothetical protein
MPTVSPSRSSSKGTAIASCNLVATRERVRDRPQA